MICSNLHRETAWNTCSVSGMLTCWHFVFEVRVTDSCYGKVLLKVISVWGPFHQCFFIVIQMRWTFHFAIIHILESKSLHFFCICHNSIAVMACGKFCGNYFVIIWNRAKQIFNFEGKIIILCHAISHLPVITEWHVQYKFARINMVWIHAHIFSWKLPVYILSISSEISTRPPWWSVNVGSGNDLAPSGNSHYLNQCWPALCYHMASLGHNELINRIVFHQWDL